MYQSSQLLNLTATTVSEDTIAIHSRTCISGFSEEGDPWIVILVVNLVYHIARP